jgi:hypothetical protein
LHSGCRVVDRRRQRTQRDIGKQSQRERGNLIKRPFGSEPQRVEHVAVGELDAVANDGLPILIEDCLARGHAQVNASVFARGQPQEARHVNRLKHR